ncbi:MAG: amidohydrolase family protein [Pseudomonadota bacterium]
MKQTKTGLLLACLALSTSSHAETERLPIIDMHLHALSLEDMGGPMAVCTNEQAVEFPGLDPRQPMTVQAAAVCAEPTMSSSSTPKLIEETVAMLERYNIYAITAGSRERLREWRAASPDRIIPALGFDDDDAEAPDVYRRLYADREFRVFAEIAPQYRGKLATDGALDAYFALAEELDIPIGIHLGEGPPGGAHVTGYGGYKAALTSPLQLEDILLKHPKLRLYVMHFGSPLVDEMIALLYSHPQVYVDIAQNNWGFPRAHFHSQLKRLTDAGFAKRIMFGSDQMIWPDTIRIAIETVEAAEFLTPEQKRDIFYNNAARFLRLSEHEIALHHTAK